MCGNGTRKRPTPEPETDPPSSPQPLNSIPPQLPNDDVFYSYSPPEPDPWDHMNSASPLASPTYPYQPLPPRKLNYDFDLENPLPFEAVPTRYRYLEPFFSSITDEDSQLNTTATSPSSKMVGAGITNLGSTCFMNAILQCLTHTVLFVRGLHSCTHPDPCAADGRFCVICAFREHINDSLALSGGVVSAKRLVDNLNYFSPGFKRFQQEDAHEFMQSALNKLGRCFQDGGDDDLVEEVFGGRLISKLRCCNCDKSSHTYEELIDLSLEIENMATLQRALESFTKVERIDEQFACESCGENVYREKQLMLSKTPSVAAFHLKRFKKEGTSVIKIDNHVYFTPELDLQPYTSGDHNDNVPLIYDLYAVVVHHGSSHNSGHYFCFVRSAPDKWHRLDDAQVTSVLEDFVLSQQAYILFYARRGTPWFSSSIMESEETEPKSVLDNVVMEEQKPDCSGWNSNDDPMDAYNECIDDCEGEDDTADGQMQP